MASKKSVRTIADIATLAGVSKSTVSRALSDSSLISDETKARIRAIAEAHNYEVHQGARNLSLQRSQTIAIVFPIQPEIGRFITDPFNIELLGAVADEIGWQDYDLLVAQTRKGSQQWVDRYLGSKRADGVILFSCDVHAETINRLAQEQAPFIVWGPQTWSSLPVCNVRSDDLAGGRLAGEHLLALGRQRIAFLGGPKKEPEVVQRYQGYAQALQAAGREIDPALVAYGNYTSQSGFEETLGLLERVPDIDAIFANNDTMAIGVLEALRDQGRRVPEEVAVVGYDGMPLAAHLTPPLTTVRQNITKAGALLVRNLIQYMADGAVTTTILPVEVVARASSVPAE